MRQMVADAQWDGNQRYFRGRLSASGGNFTWPWDGFLAASRLPEPASDRTNTGRHACRHGAWVGDHRRRRFRRRNRRSIAPLTAQSPSIACRFVDLVRRVPYRLEVP